MTSKPNVKDALVYIPAIALPVFAGYTGPLKFLVDFIVFASFAWVGMQQQKNRNTWIVLLVMIGVLFLWGLGSNGASMYPRELLIDIISIVMFVWIGLRHGLFKPMAAAVITTALIYLVERNIMLALGKGVLLLGVSLIFIIGIKRKWRLGKIIFWGSLPGIAYGLFNLFSVGLDPVGQLDLFFRENLLNVMVDFYRQNGVIQALETSGMPEAQFVEMLQKGLSTLAQLFPSAMALNGIMVVILSFLVVRPLVKKFFAIDLNLKPFKEWVLPWYAIWGGILAIALYLLGKYSNFSWMVITGLNLGLIYFLVCAVLGTAIAIHFFSSPKVPLLIKIVFVFLSIYYMLPTAILLALLGLFDLVLNFRRLPDSL